jgi:hypothetical protein
MDEALTGESAIVREPEFIAPIELAEKRYLDPLSKPARNELVHRPGKALEFSGRGFVTRVTPTRGKRLRYPTPEADAEPWERSERNGQGRRGYVGGNKADRWTSERDALKLRVVRGAVELADFVDLKQVMETCQGECMQRREPLWVGYPGISVLGR